MSRATCSLSVAGGGVSAKKREPRVIRTPAIDAVRSFTGNGTPVKGPAGNPCAMVLRARSSRRIVTALTVVLRASTRSMAASSSSVGATLRCRTSSASPSASYAS